MANATEYGMFQLLDLQLLNPNDPFNTVDSGLLASAIAYDQAQHNADIDAMLNLFAQTTTAFQQQVTQTASARNQPLDENGRALPIKPVAPYTVQHHIQGSGNAWGANFRTRQKMTNAMLANTLSSMYRGDLLWVQDHILNAFFLDTDLTLRDENGAIASVGDLTIHGLANGDQTVYYKLGSNSTATDTHYLAQSAAISDAANPYPTIKAELIEHPDNSGGDIIAFVATNLISTTEGIAEFRSAMLDPDIRVASTTTVLTGTLGLTLPMGATLRGKTDSGVWIVEWPAVPSGYIVAVSTAGPRPLARRVDPERNLNGFKAQGEQEDFPYAIEQWQRFEGYSALNRVAAVAYRVGNASWAAPTGFGVFMP